MSKELVKFKSNVTGVINDFDTQIQDLLKTFYAHVVACRICRSEVFQVINGDVPNAAFCTEGYELFRTTNFQFNSLLEVRTRITETVNLIEQRENDTER